MGTQLAAPSPTVAEKKHQRNHKSDMHWNPLAATTDQIWLLLLQNARKISMLLIAISTSPKNILISHEATAWSDKLFFKTNKLCSYAYFLCNICYIYIRDHIFLLTCGHNIYRSDVAQSLPDTSEKSAGCCLLDGGSSTWLDGGSSTCLDRESSQWQQQCM